MHVAARRTFASKTAYMLQYISEEALAAMPAEAEVEAPEEIRAGVSDADMATQREVEEYAHRRDELGAKRAEYIQMLSDVRAALDDPVGEFIAESAEEIADECWVGAEWLRSIGAGGVRTAMADLPIDNVPFRCD